jgi:hypothetical protein
MLKAGVAKLDITPPVGARMSGFAGRVFPSLAVHDPLWARALVFDDGKQRAGLVALDLIGISEKAVAEVREAAAKSAGIPKEGLLLAGTHTHSGPTFWDDGSFTDQERDYWDALPAKLAEVVAQAAGNLAPARIGAASGWTAVGINRREVVPGNRVVLGRNHFGRFDPEVGVVRVEGADGRPIACLMNYACHAVCLMMDNYLTSADYPGFAVDSVEHRIGKGVTGLFFNGACGNINPREAGVGHGLAAGGSFLIAQRAGTEVAREAARAWAKAALHEDATISLAQQRIALPTNRQRALKRAEEALAEAERAAAGPQEERTPYMTWYAPPNPEAARRRVARLKEEGDAPVECEIQAIRVGPVAFVAWPGEVFCEFGMEVKENSPFRPTYVIGYANGSIGYVPTPEAFQEGGYEPETAAHLADNAGLVLVDETMGLVAKLAGNGERAPGR